MPGWEGNDDDRKKRREEGLGGQLQVLGRSGPTGGESPRRQ